MADPPELLAFAVTNLLVFGFGAVLTGLSYVAYRSNGRTRSFRTSTIGFGLITLGGLVEPVYQLLLKSDYHLGGRELLTVQATEGGLIALGLGLLFYSIYLHNTRGRTTGTGFGQGTFDP